MGKAVATLALSALATAFDPAAAGAETYYQFQSPSGDIACAMGSLGNKAFADCEITDHAWVAPARPDRCEGEWGDRLELRQGTAAGFVCNSDSLRGSNLPTLTYGSAWTVNPLTCDSEPTGMTCTDGSTGRYFRLSRESYELH
ncbi:DUF6636 domain-containing protein [Mycobacterium sp. 1164966.3]|uniref:DUF6636 domain-containing protein n=1 Tax=Mycobacterium sp. 1164966.3 TaxID=1856861 RepID=UPI000835B5BA|nr:DUF6636 domain-containing protein [Mycobacterium sp. 1164966.3]